VDVERARPRVASFYGLEALRAAEGSLPGFGALAERAGSAAEARLGWPAPEDPRDAIDASEFDLAVLSRLIRPGVEPTAGAARYLLDANAHLARSLRARARRWLVRWTPADGFVEADELGREALARHAFGVRSFSPTALQNFAVCPYRFFLQAIQRLEPREEPIAIEVIDPLTRGAMFHEAQFAVLTRLESERGLPVTPANLEAALAAVDAALEKVADEYKERLAPAIPRVWEDGVQAIRADLREWLRRAARDVESGWVPHRFELSFGIVDRDRANADPSSVAEPVPLPGGLRLRGAIDLVERHARRGTLRATDHKTGKVWADDDVVVGGGEVLQPVLYALACEHLLDDAVDSGRLYYCTATGDYEERVVPLNDVSRAAAAAVIEIVGRALDRGFLPAAPAGDACEWCDYRRVCGPYEKVRTARKKRDALADLDRLRSMP
jgi:RecB family exonuclease